jgi:preprotein translocase subunit YajC
LSVVPGRESFLFNFKKLNRKNKRYAHKQWVTDDGQKAVQLIGLSDIAKLWAGAPAPGGSPIEGLLSFTPLIIMFVIFYFLLIRPQQKRQKEIRDMLANLKKGDKVITTGGLYGTIVGLNDSYVQLRIADQVKVKVSRNAIAGFQNEAGNNGEGSTSE